MAAVRDFVLALEAQNGGCVGLFQRPLVDREFKLVEDQKLLLSKYRLSETLEDKLIWIHDVAGNFSVKKLSYLLKSVNPEASEFNFERVWTLKVPSKIRSFVWMLVLDRLPSKEFLLKRGVSIPVDMVGCPWCGLGVENTFHLLIGCRFIMVFWQRICKWWKPSWENPHDIEAFFNECFTTTVTADPACTGIVESVWWLDPASSLVVEQKNYFDYAHALAGQVQFLVDGSSSVSKAGFGGYLRDEAGNIRIMFSGLTQNCGAKFAQLMAIVTALEDYIDAGWPNNIGLSVLSDLQVTIRWISNISLRPW
ncbi:hypothetical protein V6N13_100433 [Hibiscus sabdariffa]